MPSEFRFSIPSLPIEIYHKFQELRKAHGLTQKQCLILGVMCICDLGSRKAAEESNPQDPVATIDYLVEKVREQYPSKKEGI